MKAGVLYNPLIQTCLCLTSMPAQWFKACSIAVVCVYLQKLICPSCGGFGVQRTILVVTGYNHREYSKYYVKKPVHAAVHS